MPPKFWAYIGLIVAVLATLYGAYRYGRYVEDLEWTTDTQAQTIKAQNDREELRRTQQALADAHAKAILDEQEAATETQKVVTKEVIVYVETTPPVCDMPTDWVLQYRNSAAPRNPEARSGADEAGARTVADASEPGAGAERPRSGVTENDVLRVDSEIHDLYYLCEFRLRRLQEYVTTQCKNPEK